MTRKWRIVVGSDNAAVNYKNELKAMLERDPRVASVYDVGVAARSDATAYAHIAVAAARRVAGGEADRALLLCGTGLGVAIAANKVPGVRAVTAHDSYSVARSVLSNNAQVLTMGERVIGLELAKTLVDQWLDYEFDPTSASAAKVEAIGSYESEGAPTGTGGAPDQSRSPTEAVLPGPSESVPEVVGSREVRPAPRPKGAPGSRSRADGERG